MKSVMSHNFARVPRAEIERSSFDRSHGYKTTFDAGWLIPIFVDEALPGDTFNLKLNAFARLATPLKPIMDNMYMDTFFFSVPYRLVWSSWNKFNGEQESPGDSTDYLIPQTTAPAGGYAVGSIHDYMGIPTGVAGIKHSALPFRAYTLIYNEWFRDQNMVDRVPFYNGDIDDAPSTQNLQRRGKRHDYFTSCLPWPQKGDTINLPIGQSMPIVGNGQPIYWKTSVGDSDRAMITDTGGGVAITDSPTITEQRNLYFSTNPARTGLVGDLSSATSTTINALREAFQLQRLLERDARGGTRYTEIIKSHFGVTSPDARLQRPEYLGGGSSPINVHPVTQTSGTGTYASTPQGNLSAFGTVQFGGHGFSKAFTEHCIIIGLVNVRADLTYQQGLNRMWSRRTRWDHYWPALSHLGEQAVLNKEIFAQGTAEDDLVFGYQERYAEYRYKPSQITGEFRSTFAQSLDVWHLSQEFANLPQLTKEFIEEDPPLDRVIAVTSEPHFLYDSYINLTCARPMPVFGVPGYIDHF